MIPGGIKSVGTIPVGKNPVGKFFVRGISPRFVPTEIIPPRFDLTDFMPPGTILTFGQCRPKRPESGPRGRYYKRPAPMSTALKNGEVLSCRTRVRLLLNKLLHILRERAPSMSEQCKHYYIESEM